jgi:hypothetical protein
MIAKRDLVREMIRHIAQRMMEMNAERALQDVPRSVGRLAAAAWSSTAVSSQATASSNGRAGERSTAKDRAARPTGSD